MTVFVIFTVVLWSL